VGKLHQEVGEDHHKVGVAQEEVGVAVTIRKIKKEKNFSFFIDCM
jgi:hypothetical protein